MILCLGFFFPIIATKIFKSLLNWCLLNAIFVSIRALRYTLPIDMLVAHLCAGLLCVAMQCMLFPTKISYKTGLYIRGKRARVISWTNTPFKV